MPKPILSFSPTPSQELYRVTILIPRNRTKGDGVDFVLFYCSTNCRFNICDNFLFSLVLTLPRAGYYFLFHAIRQVVEVGAVSCHPDHQLRVLSRIQAGILELSRVEDIELYFHAAGIEKSRHQCGKNFLTTWSCQRVRVETKIHCIPVCCQRSIYVSN